MQITARHNLYRLGVVAAVAALTSVACNNSDYKMSDNANPSDSSVAVNPAGPSTPAGQPATTHLDTSMGKTTDTIDNMGHVVPSTRATSPSAERSGSATQKPDATAKASTPATHTAGVHNRKRATTSIVMTDAAAGTTAPQFPGGQKALDNYVNDHINYPQNAVDNDVTGIVRVSFVVDEQGRITKVKLMNPQKVGEGLDEEALRVVTNMPDWKPATIHGKKVKTRLELPISFQVES